MDLPVALKILMLLVIVLPVAVGVSMWAFNRHSGSEDKAYARYLRTGVR